MNLEDQDTASSALDPNLKKRETAPMENRKLGNSNLEVSALGPRCDTLARMLRKLALAILLMAGLSTAYARVFEIRTYTTSQKMDALKALFRDHTLALFKKHGFEVIGFWVPQDPPRSENTFVYMLAFPDRETAKTRWEAFHKDPEWLKVRAEFEARRGKIVDKIESQFISPVDFSPLK
jgi:hypothetical protein